MKPATLLLFILTATVANAQFSKNKKYYEPYEGYASYWENIFGFQLQLDTAFYVGEGYVYTRHTADGFGVLTKYYPDGNIHIEGRNIEVRNNRHLRLSGGWKVYSPNHSLRKEFEFKNGRKFGDYVEYDESGVIVKKRIYNQKLQTGFCISLLTADLRIESSGGKNLDVYSGYGFDIGFLMSYKLADNLNVRTIIAESFHEYRLRVDNEDLLLDYLFIKLPLTLEYNWLSDSYLTGGISNNIKVNGKEDREFDRTTFSIKNYDLSMEMGLSHHLKFSKFTLAPEIRYSHSLNDMRKESNAEFSDTITSIRRSQFTFTLIARG